MKIATNVVRDALVKLDPADTAAFDTNAAAYQSKLDALQAWAKSKIAELPRDERKLVTSHDAFQYFSREFGFTVYPIEGVSTQDEPSSKKVADIIQTIKDSHVKAVFFESIENPKVLGEITRESGAKLGGELYADGLGTGDAASYEGMFRHNVNTIVNALK
jgi:zinc/manganese transport system substrate-binding protein